MCQQCLVALKENRKTMIIPPSDIMSDEEYFRAEKSNDVVSALTDAIDAQKHSTPNYYAIIPAFVRYNKSLTYLEKILYSEISALSNKLGYCYASNAYFTESFGNSERTIQRSLKHLSELGFISIVTEIGAIGANRKIYLCATKVSSSNDKNVAGVSEENGVDISQKGQKQGSNSIVNSISSISKDIVEDNPAQANPTKLSPGLQAIPSWLGKSSYARLVKLYEMMWEYKMGTKPTQIKTSSPGSNIIKCLLKKYTEELSALIIIVHFDWRGVNGSDNLIAERLRNAGYPITWVLNSSPMYEVFIRDYLKITTEKEAIDRIHKVLTEISNAPE